MTCGFDERGRSVAFAVGCGGVHNGSELSFIALERETGVTRQSIMGFVRGERSLRLDMADKLAEYFGIEVIRRKAK
jgi:hypothetical protein